jgi:hypothetical protein
MTVNAEQILAVWNRLPRWAQSSLYALDRRINAKFGGDPTETVSSRLARSRNRGEWQGLLGCAILDHYDPPTEANGQRGHCDRSIKAEHRDA